MSDRLFSVLFLAGLNGLMFGMGALAYYVGDMGGATVCLIIAPVITCISIGALVEDFARPAQGMPLRENSRSEVEGEARQPGPPKEDAPNG